MHTMTKINEHEGSEEWMCFSCGRHLLVSWDPVFRKTVLKEGDLLAQHTGLRNNMPVRDKRDVPAALFADPRLEPWLEWMNKIGFENLWDRDTQ